MKKLLVVTAVLEAGTGLGLLAAPSMVAQMLLGAALEAPAALTVARVAGAALLALGLACWLAASDAQSCAGRGVVSAMVIYNLGAAIVLGLAGIHGPSAGIALWPAVILHLAMTVWCVTNLLTQPNAPSASG
jgi:quinol-cytochrome oxidoreductase complex cytochrome b subunit